MSIFSRKSKALFAATALPFLLDSCSLISMSAKQDPVQYTIMSAIQEPFKSDVAFSYAGKEMTESELEKKIGVTIYGDTNSRNLKILYATSTILAKNTGLFSLIDAVVFVPEKHIPLVSGLSIAGKNTLKVRSSGVTPLRQAYILLHEAAHSYSDSLCNTPFWSEWAAVKPVQYYGRLDKDEFSKLKEKFVPHNGSMTLYGLKNPREHVADLTAYVTMYNNYSHVPLDEKETFRKYIDVLVKYKFVSPQYIPLANRTLQH